MQLFGERQALAHAGAGRVCQMVQDWFAAQLVVSDPDMQLRLLVASLKSLIAGESFSRLISREGDEGSVRFYAEELATRASKRFDELIEGLEPDDDVTARRTKLVRALQTVLKRVGCDAGEIDGVWGTNATNALAEFVRVTKMKLQSDEPLRASAAALNMCVQEAATCWSIGAPLATA